MAPPEWPSSPPRATEHKKNRPPRTVPKKWLDDNRSRGSDGRSSTPSSVHLAVALSRDLSDLSGSYMHGRDANSTSVASSRVDPTRPWREAHVLSSALPHHPQPRTECDDSVGIVKRQATATTTLLMESSGVIEVIRPDEIRDQRQSPLLILLMDPSRKLYELMQLWVDVETDSVRDVLHAIQSALIDKEWRQDYDGLFQVRNNHFSQLIHILHLHKYDVQPHEVWIAKPWSMAAKATVAHAVELLNYLKGVDMLRYCSPVENRKAAAGSVKPKTDDAVLVLTKEAKSRTFVPGVVLKHRHATQFLSFSPPFEPMVVRVDVLSADHDDIDGCSQLSDSYCGMSLESRGSRVSVTDLIASRTAMPKKTKVTSFGKVSRYPSDATSSLDGDTKKTRTVGRALSMLNCSACKQSQQQREAAAFESSSTMDSTLNGPLWNVWEEESKAGESVVSDSAPLIARPAAFSATIAEF